MRRSRRNRNRWLAVGVEPLEIRALLSAGAPDLTFGTNGYVTSTDGTTATLVKTDSQDRIVTAAASDGVLSVARYTSAGALDTSFGSGGVVTTHFDATVVISAMAIQADDKILIVGAVDGNMLVVRYNVHGSLDDSFQGTGTRTTDLGGAGDRAVDVKLQGDGRIVVVGNRADSQNKGSSIIVVRYDSNGSLDATFGHGGMTTYSTPGAAAGASSEHAVSLAIQTDGKLVVAAWIGSGSLGFSAADTRMQVLRYDSSGSLDQSFGQVGVDTLSTVGANYGAITGGLVVQPDGRILISGTYGVLLIPLPYYQPDVTAFLRLHSNGSIDKTFGNNGLFFPDVVSGNTFSRSFGTAMTLQDDGRILVTGYDFGVGSGVARFNINGSIDTTFGTNGIAPTSEFVHSFTVDGKGRVVTAGTDGSGDFVVGRLNGDALDPVYRLYLDPTHPGGDKHYYTTSPLEFHVLVSAGWNDETTGHTVFALHSNPVAGAVPLHMLYNPNDGEHYYTLSDGERDILVSLGWQFQRDEGYMFPIVSGSAAPPGTTEIFHIYNQKYGGNHIFTQDPQQVQDVLHGFPGVWVSQASLGYAVIDSGLNVFASSAAAPTSAALQAVTAPATSADSGSIEHAATIPAIAIETSQRSTNVAGLVPEPIVPQQPETTSAPLTLKIQASTSDFSETPPVTLESDDLDPFGALAGK